MKFALSAFTGIVLTASVPCFGQAVSGTINGLVLDASGAAVGGAGVVVRNEGTSVIGNFTTNSVGFYSAPELIPGTYSVRVKVRGFKAFIKTGLVLDVDSVVRVDVALSVGEVNESVTVAAEAAVLKTDKADVGAVISDRTLTEMPVLSRNVSQLVEILPGSLRSTSAAFIGENPGSDTNGFVNGRGSGNNYHQLDGIDNEETIQGVAMVNPNIDSLQEIKITTNSYDAEFGQVSGAVFQASTKSGSNQYHGSLFEYLQNNDLFARDPFTQAATGIAPWRWNEFGGSLGGPIKRDKLFFFGDYQGLRSRQGSTLQLPLPSPLMKQGNFSEVANQYVIYDPSTGNTSGAGRMAFPGNIIPASRLDPVAMKLAAMIPDPNTPDPSFSHDYTKSGSFISDTNSLDGRLDYDPSDRTRMFIRYSYLGSVYNAPPIFGTVAGGPGFGPQAEIGGTRTQNLSFNYSRVLKPNFIAEFRFGFSRFRSNLAQTDVGLQTANQVGLTGINQNSTLTDGLPQLLWNGPVAGGSNSYLGNPYSNFYEVEQTFQYVTNWSLVKGAHTLKWGADLRPRVECQRIDKSLRGAFTFSNLGTATSSASGTSGLGFASFLLGIPQSFTRGYYTRLPFQYQDRDAVYFQDEWRVMPRLSLTLGLRWEYFSPTYGGWPGGASNFDFANGLMLLSESGPYNKYAGVQPRYTNFAPRFGLAYSVDSKTVVRLGYGRSFAVNTGGANFGTLCCQWPESSQQNLSAPTTYTGVFTLEQGPPSAATSLNVPSSGALVPADGQTIYGVPFNNKTTVQDAWNFTVQRQFTSTFTAEIAYVGSMTRHNYVTVNLNAPSPGPGTLPSREYYSILEGFTNESINMRAGLGNVNYNSVQAHLNKRFHNGYQFTASYTLQKTMADNYTDPFNRELYKGPAAYPGHWLSLGHVWELPFGPGHLVAQNSKGVAKMLISGWEFSGFTQFQDGTPFTPSMNANTLNTNYAQLPNRIASGHVSDPGVNGWFDPRAFAIPAAYTFGNTGTGILHTPGMWIGDWALNKSVAFRSPLNENTRLVIRWEAFNALNHVNLGSPTTTIDAPASQAGHIFDITGTMRRMQLGIHLYF